MDPRQLALLPGQPGTAQNQSDRSNDRGLILSALKRVVELSPVGYITEHMEEILGLPPEIARIDAATFRCTTSAAGLVTAQPATVRLNTDYESEIFAMIGTCSEPNEPAGATNGIVFGSFLEFNVREQGRNFDMFTTNIPMSELVGLAGSLGQVEWPRGSYVFRAHADVQVRFTALAGLAANTTIKDWTVTLLLNLARKK